MSSHGPELTPEDDQRLLQAYEEGEAEKEQFWIDALEASFKKFRKDHEGGSERGKRIFTSLFMIGNYGWPEELEGYAEGQDTFEDVLNSIDNAFPYHRENVRLSEEKRSRGRRPELGVQYVLQKLRQIWVERTGKPASIAEHGPFVSWADETLERLFPDQKMNAFSLFTSIAQKRRKQK